MNTQLLSIKAKKFGVRLAAFRQKKGLTTEVLSQWTGISNEKLKLIEQGETSVTLPEIELLALKLGFTTDDILSGELPEIIGSNDGEGITKHYSDLRDRMIALILRKTRTEQNQTLESISAKCGIEIDELNQYESGIKSIPLPILECLCDEYKIPLLSLISQKPTNEPTIEPIPEPEAPTFEANDILSDEISEFVHNPANLPYLELARKLSELDAAKLRSIAEGLLEITY
jgi:transcriptional regulator with XRE-family HTH domain